MDSIAADVALPSQADVLSVARRVVELGCSRRVLLGTAESCTGGLVSAALTAIPGSSAVVRGGVASYSLDVKRSLLNVSEEVLDDPQRGAVSLECAAQMAQGGASALGASLVVSVTGIAGPGGAEPGKPVGTVCFGLSHDGVTSACRRQFSGARKEVRTKAVWVALQLLCAELEQMR